MNKTFISVGAYRRALCALGAGAVLSLGLGGCAGILAPEPPEVVVRKLATQRWQALLAGNFEKAYTFATPSYRQIHTPATYRIDRSGVPFKWLAAEVSRVECALEKCKVDVRLESKPMVPFAFKGNITSGVDEVWVLEAGKWWMLEPL